MVVRFVSPDEAAELIADNATVLVCGNGSVLNPDTVLAALERRFLETGRPRNLTEVHPVVMGFHPGTGIDRFAHEGMTKRVIGSGYGVWKLRNMNEMIRECKVEAYNLPMGVLFQLMRAIAAGQPGLITPVGLHTYVDPRVEGCGWNEISKDDSLVKVINLEGQEFLFYRGYPIDVAIIMGTTADEDGNISVEDEPSTLGILPFAMAAKNSGGVVIAQVKRKAARGSLHPRMVAVPGVLVDAVVIDPDQPQSVERFEAGLTGQLRVPLDQIPRMDEGVEKAILKRAAKELQPGDLVNLGFGLPAYMPWVAVELGLHDQVKFTTEHGTIGGIPAGWTLFGTAYNADMLLDSSSLFDLYAGGGLDVTCLGMAEVDAQGNVNVSAFGERKPGCGGFIDITFKAKKIIFCGTMTAKGLREEIRDGQLVIVQEGTVKKFVPQVQQITLNGREAVRKNQQVLYVTDRCVFRLTPNGLQLVEVAPGIRVDEHIRPVVQFEFSVADRLGVMDVF